MSEGNRCYFIFNSLLFKYPFNQEPEKTVAVMWTFLMIWWHASRAEKHVWSTALGIFLLPLWRVSALERGFVSILCFQLLTAFAMGSQGWSSERGIRVRQSLECLDFLPARLLGDCCAAITKVRVQPSSLLCLTPGTACPLPFKPGNGNSPASTMIQAIASSTALPLNSLLHKSCSCERTFHALSHFECISCGNPVCL